MSETVEPASARVRPGLGRGLSALLGDARATEAMPREGEVVDGTAVRLLPLDRVRPHPDQPRRHFAEGALDELAASIAQRGVIQPIVVRPVGAGFEIVAGERRWRAAQRAGLTEIPALIRDLGDSQAFEIALIENIQREDLNPIEEAEGYRRLVDDFGHNQASLARLVDKSRSHVANLLRLLDLPAGVRDHVREGRLSMGHARALIGRDGADVLADQVIARGLSVRETERLARRPARRNRDAAPDPAVGDSDIVALESHLAELLGLTVRIQRRGEGGTLALDYRTLDQLDLLCQRLSGERF